MQEGITDMYHSITFGDGTLYPVGHPKQGQFAGANTWDDWHLIPSSRPTVVQAGVSTNFVDIPGRKDGPIDMSEYLTNGIVYTGRSGSFEFYVDNDHEYWETIRSKIVQYLHGKRMKMCLEDDPNYYYEGRFSLSEWKSGSWFSSVIINYVVGPYKYRITTGERWIWDPFNFDLERMDAEYQNQNEGWL